MNQFDRTRQHRNKGKAVVLAGMVGAVVGAVACGGGMTVLCGGVAALDSIPTLIVVLMLTAGGAVAGGLFTAGIRYVMD